MTEPKNMPKIPNESVEEKPSKAKAIIIIVFIFVLLIVLACVGFWHFKVKGSELPEKPFDTSNLISEDSPINNADPLSDTSNDYEIKSTEIVEELINTKPLDDSFDELSNLPVSQPSTDASIIPVENSIPVMSADRLDTLEASIKSLNEQVSSLIDLVDAINLANIKQDKKISDFKSSSYKSKAPKSIHKSASKKPVIKKSVMAIKTKPSPPFTFVGIEIWDGESKAVITLNQNVTQLSKGESSNNWVLLKSVYPDKAEFMDRKSGQKVILFSDGRRPHAS